MAANGGPVTPKPHRHRRSLARDALALFGLGALACSSGGSGAPSGDAGTTGAAGAGMSGTAGAAAGSTGAAGAAAGTTGAAGAAGSAGATATAGSAGATAGTTGTTGASGAGGATGAAGAAGGATGACPAGALLCDGFESYASPTDLAAAWKVTATMATLAVDATKPFAGVKGLHVTSTGGTPVGVVIKDGAPLFPIAGNAFYGRVMFWLTKNPPGAVHWNNVQSAGFLPDNRWGKYGWGGMYGTILAGYTIRTMATDTQAVIDCSKPSKLALPEKKWTCLEWQFDGAGSQMHLWLDNQLVADADIVKTGTACVTPKPPNDTWTAPAFANLTLGWMQYQTSTTPVELWMDEVAVATTRIGCPPPP
jgi:hypothetical protein